MFYLSGQNLIQWLDKVGPYLTAMSLGERFGSFKPIIL